MGHVGPRLQCFCNTSCLELRRSPRQFENCKICCMIHTLFEFFKFHILLVFRNIRIVTFHQRRNGQLHVHELPFDLQMCVGMILSHGWFIAHFRHISL